MPADSQIVEIRAKWRWEEGDGSACLACGEPAWLRLRRLVMRITGIRKIQKTKNVLCQSCGELIDDDGEVKR